MAKGYIVTVEVFVDDETAKQWRNHAEKQGWERVGKKHGAADAVAETLEVMDLNPEIKNVRKVK